MQAQVNEKWHDREMNNVLYVSELKRSLFSVGVMTDKKFKYYADDNKCEFRDQAGNVSCVGVKRNGLYYMLLRTNSVIECNVSKTNSLKIWHERLGHINFKRLIETHRNLELNGLKLNSEIEFFCEACQFGKQTRKSHKRNDGKERREKPGEKVHSDVCGPMIPELPSGSRYFVIFKDESSSYRTVYF